MSDEVHHLWVMYVEGGGPYPIETTTTKFYPNLGIALHNVQGLEGIPKTLGTHPPSKNYAPFTGDSLAPPTELGPITIEGNSWQQAKNYENLCMNSAPDVQFKPYTSVTIKRLSSVSGNPSLLPGNQSLLPTIEFKMSGPIMIQVEECKTQIPTDIEFKAMVYWAGGGVLMRTDMTGGKLRPFMNVYCSDTKFLSMMANPFVNMKRGFSHEPSALRNALNSAKNMVKDVKKLF